MSLRVYHLNGLKFFIAQISIAPVRIFLHWSSENISEYFKTSEPFTLFSVTNA